MAKEMQSERQWKVMGRQWEGNDQTRGGEWSRQGSERTATSSGSGCKTSTPPPPAAAGFASDPPPPPPPPACESAGGCNATRQPVAAAPSCLGMPTIGIMLIVMWPPLLPTLRSLPLSSALFTLFTIHLGVQPLLRACYSLRSNCRPPSMAVAPNHLSGVQPLLGAGHHGDGGVAGPREPLVLLPGPALLRHQRDMTQPLSALPCTAISLGPPALLPRPCGGKPVAACYRRGL